MGKRELLLFLGFLAFGAIVYQATAPPPEPNKEGFSFSKFVGQVQAEIKGEQAETQVERTASADAPDGDGRLVIPQFRGTLTIVGEDRRDVSARLKATVYGMDDNQAKARANDVNLTLQPQGDDISAQISLPKEVHRRPQLELIVSVPTHLGLKLEVRNGQADLRRVGDVRIENSRGKFTMAEVGEVEGALENSDLEIVRSHGITLKLSRTKARLEEIDGELTVEADHGELRLQQLHGAGKLTLERLDCEIDAVHGPLHIEPTHVGLNVRNVAAPLTVKGEHTEVMATLDGAVPVTIETTDEPIDLRAPHAGVTIDARTENGQIRVADAGAAESTPDDQDKPEQPESSEKRERRDLRDRPEPIEREPRAQPAIPPPPAPPAPPAPPSSMTGSRSGQRRLTIKLHGGGPLITLRNERGDIVIR